MEKTMEKIVALAKGRGFVYPGSVKILPQIFFSMTDHNLSQ